MNGILDINSIPSSSTMEGPTWILHDHTDHSKDVLSSQIIYCVSILPPIRFRSHLHSIYQTTLSNTSIIVCCFLLFYFSIYITIIVNTRDRFVPFKYCLVISSSVRDQGLLVAIATGATPTGNFASIPHGRRVDFVVKKFLVDV